MVTGVSKPTGISSPKEAQPSGRISPIQVKPKTHIIPHHMLQKRDMTKDVWFKALHTMMKDKDIKLTSENIRRSIPKEASDDYSFAHDLADALEKAENIRAKVAKGENPNPTLPNEGFAFIEHDAEVVANIEELSQATYDAITADATCRKHLEQGHYIWIDLERSSTSPKLMAEITTQNDVIDHTVDLDLNIYTALKDTVEIFKKKIQKTVEDQIGDPAKIDPNIAPLMLQIGGNKDAKSPHKDNIVQDQKYGFDPTHNNVQSFTLTQALGERKQTELVLAAFKPFIKGGLDYAEGDSGTFQEFMDDDIPKEFRVSSEKLPYTSVFGARTLGQERPSYKRFGRRDSIIHIPPQNDMTDLENNEAD